MQYICANDTSMEKIINKEDKKDFERIPILRQKSDRIIDSEVYSFLIKNGFSIYHGTDDFDCMLRLREIHYLVWTDNLKHFSIAVYNEWRKWNAGGGIKKWNIVMIPKPIYTIADAKKLIGAII